MSEVEFETDYGPVGVAVRDGEGFGDEPAARIEAKITAASLSLKDSLDVIRPIAEALLAQTETISDPAGSTRKLTDITAEIGLQLGGKGRFIIAEAEATASLKVTLTWKAS